ncbi:MAG: hypothetical protein IKS19_03890 [Clostridia bacterium]|nr:hypothetical protein [Clostridia bacterium]
MASIFEISKGAVRAKEYPGCTSQFFILQKYEKYIQTRLAVDPDKPPALENYRGAGRRGINFYMPLKRGISAKDKKLLRELDDFTQDIDEFLLIEENAVRLKGMFADSADYDIIWARVADSDDEAPAGYCSLGFDVCYPLCFDETFSAVLTAANRMKLGDRLNGNGLFDSPFAAQQFLVDYAKQDFCDEGEFCISEIFGKPDEEKIIVFPGKQQ